MKIIPTAVHGVLDYVVSLLVAALPFLFGWEGATRPAFVALGAAGVVYSLLTDYEAGAWRVLPMRVHLALDVAFIAGLVALAVATPVTGLRVVCGVAAVAAAGLVVLTQPAPRRQDAGASRPRL